MSNEAGFSAPEAEDAATDGPARFALDACARAFDPVVETIGKEPARQTVLDNAIQKFQQRVLATRHRDRNWHAAETGRGDDGPELWMDEAIGGGAIKSGEGRVEASL